LTTLGDIADGLRAMRWATWGATVGLVVIVLALRVAYLALWCPYELTGDEAHYWEWSRRPDLSYYSKGPGVAWTIALSTAALGNTELGVRLPAALFGALSMLIMARLATAVSGDARAGFVAAAAFALAPVFQATSLLMTIDGPFVAMWLAAAWAGWYVFSHLERGGGVYRPMVALGAALGVGFLYKYTILLLPVGMIGWALVRRRRLAGDASCWKGLFVAAFLFGVLISPVLIWNALEGWPTVRHLIGALLKPSRRPPHGQDNLFAGEMACIADIGGVR